MACFIPLVNRYQIHWAYRLDLNFLKEVPCHFRCSTIKKPHCSMAVSIQHISKWCVPMSENFPVGCKTTNQQNKTYYYYIIINILFKSSPCRTDINYNNSDLWELMSLTILTLAEITLNRKQQINIVSSTQQHCRRKNLSKGKVTLEGNLL